MEKLNKLNFTEGLSKTAISRFGGYTEKYSANINGLLCLNATADTLSYNIKNYGDTILGRIKFDQPF